MNKKAKANILLFITAFIWGTAFVAQKAGTMLEPFTYNGIRMVIGSMTLLPVIAFFSRKKTSDLTPEEKQAEKSTLIKGGLSCGIVLFIASNLQQYGLYFETDAGKAGFITALYIVMVPVLGIFLKKKVGLRMWMCVLIGAVGFYLLTMAGKGTGFTLEKGDFFVLLCAFVFSLHILVIDHFSPKCDGIKLSCMQFFVAGVLGLIMMALFETPVLADILECWLPILYTGVLSAGVAYTLQVVAQKDTDPTTASLIMSLESVFAVLAGVAIYSEKLTMYEFIGCVVIFAAVIISQLPSKNEAA